MTKTVGLTLLGFIVLITYLIIWYRHETTTKQEGTGGIQWVDPNQLQRGPIRHQTLPEDIVARIKAIRTKLSEVDASSLEEWLDDFKRDMNPEREVLIWETIARAYSTYTSDKELNLNKKKELLGILLVGRSAPIQDALDHLKLKFFTKEEAREALETLASSRNIKQTSSND